MDKELFQRVEELFQEAIDLPPERRSEFLNGACGHDSTLRSEVAKLLDRSQSGAAIPWIRENLASGDDHECNGQRYQTEDCAGQTIGPYTLIRLIGEGGFGSVYLAQQQHPVRRTVALKIIKLGMDTKQVIARFEAERQALAMMDHPGIARVLEAGATDQGRPYFVMELVDGVPITRYCDAASLTTRQRLELLAAVCQAVQHAHQKGVIHRDLKPSNVLVTLQDGRPAPKVIDFGIAKAMRDRLTERTLRTDDRHLIGTPAYMSPEQAEMGGVDVDTRTDIYSLGVLLYELLTGTTPFDSRTPNGSTPSDLQRTLRELEPARPSSRIADLSRSHLWRSAARQAQPAPASSENGHETLSIQAIARQRCTDPDRLRRELRGDLDWIVMKCLEKDRARRYETANGLALDLQRHLNHEPVSAGPPGTMYRLAKFVRRRRGLVVAAAATGLALVLGLIGTTFGVFWALEERDAAQKSAKEQSTLRQEADQARTAAERAGALATDHAARAQSVSAFLIRTLGLTDVDITQEASMSVDALLDRAADEVGLAFADQPQAEAVVRTAIGRSYASRGEIEGADVHLARALEIQRRIAPDDGQAMYEILWPYWRVLLELSDPSATTRQNEALSVGRRIIKQRQPQVADALDGFVKHWKRPFDRAKADEFFHTALTHARNDLPADDPMWLYLGDHFQIAGRATRSVAPQAAAVYLNEALEIYRRQLPETNTRIVHTLDELILLEITDRRFEHAQELVNRALDLASKVLPANHWYLAALHGRLARCRIEQHRFAEAEALLQEHQPTILARRGVASAEATEAARLFVELYELWNKPEQADAHRVNLARCLAGRLRGFNMAALDQVIGPSHPELIAAIRDLRSAVRQPDSDIAPALDRVLDLRRAVFADDHPVAACIGEVIIDWATIHRNRGGPVDQTNRLLLEGLAIDRAGGCRHYYKRVNPVWQLANHCNAFGQFEQAEAYAREGIAIFEAGPPDRTGYVDCFHSVLGSICINQDRLDEAEALLVPAFERLRAFCGETNGNTVIAAGRLAELYAQQGRRAEAERLATLVLQSALHDPANGEVLNSAAWDVVKLPGYSKEIYALALQAAELAVATQPDRASWVNTLGAAYVRTGQHQRALQTLERAAQLRDTPRISDAAFTALALRGLGRHQEADAALQNLRTVFAQAPYRSAAHRLIFAETEAQFAQPATR
ncbi:MAG: protein kinase [Phycisphaerales bacterium]|nr:protein kinase [Phycisphaerales bacterium]